MTEDRRTTEIREIAETLVEDRGFKNALAWAEHCMVRDPTGGFWLAVVAHIRTMSEGAAL